MQASSINTAQRRPGTHPATTSNASSFQNRHGHGARDHPQNIRSWRGPPLRPNGHLKRPWRHADIATVDVDVDVRSTKAGARTRARTPETPRHQGRPGRLLDGAQRRPGRAPRRHHVHQTGRLFRRHRSTKAGARTPETPPEAIADRRHIQRLTKAGARTPETHSPPWKLWRLSPTLNEGRGAHPGDTLPWPSNTGRWARSTKAGARTPETPGHRHGVSWAHGLRSTKAGARTPETRPPARRRPPACSALNEGRGAHPGDTGSSRATTTS